MLPVAGPMPGTLYLQVEDLEWWSDQYNENATEAETEVGDTPEEGLLVWLGQGVDDVISDVETIVSAASSYGNIPLTTQVDLQRDMDCDWPRSWQTVGVSLAGICRQSQSARLASEPEQGTSYYMLLNEQGWHLREWQSLLAQDDDYERAMASMILLSESDREHYRYADPLASYVSDPSIIFRIHPNGLSLGLPVFTAFGRGVMLSGPVVIAGEYEGISAAQVRLVAQEVFFVEESIRGGVTSLWSHVWTTIGTRASR